MKKIFNVFICVLMALSLFIGNATVAYASAPDQKSAAQVQREKAAAERQKRAEQQKKQREKAAAEKKKEQEKKQKQREAEKLKREKEAEKAALKKQKEEENAEKDALKASEKKQKETSSQQKVQTKNAQTKKTETKKEVKPTAKKDDKKQTAKKENKNQSVKKDNKKQADKKKEQTKTRTASKQTAKKKNTLTPEEQYEQRVKKVEAYNKRVIAQQRRDLTHSIGAWGYFGYSALFQDINNQTNAFAAKTLGGFGGGFGLGYQLRYEHFLFNTGLELEVYNSASRITSPDATTLIQQYGMTPYPSMTYQYEYSNFIDNQQAGYVQLPLLFGGEWGRYYFLAGPKIGMGVWGTSAQKATLTTTITDSELAVPLENMYTHALATDRQYEGSNKLSFGLNVGLAFEAGIYLDEWLRPQPKKTRGRQKKDETNVLQQMRYRIGIYGDYGLLSVQQNSNITSTDAVPVHINDMSSPLDVTTLPSLSVPAAQTASVNPFEVGVKLAVFFDFPKKQRKLLNLPAEPAPTLIARVVNEETGEGVQGAMVNIYNAERDKTINKTTNRQGYIQQRIRKGEYRLSANRGGFYNSDTITVDHQKNAVDTFTLTMLQQPVPENYYLTGFITDAETHKGLEAQLQIFSIETRNVIYTGQATEDGLFVTDLPAGTYIARTTMQGYMPSEDTLRFEADTLSLVLNRVKEGRKMVFHNMYFATGKTRILPESEPAFEELTQFMQENPDINIVITGHTDNIGTDASNQRLSEGRANAVRRDLIMRGVDAGRIETDGKGETEPIADNDTDEGRAKNRRIEITVVEQQE